MAEEKRTRTPTARQYPVRLDISQPAANDARTAGENFRTAVSNAWDDAKANTQRQLLASFPLIGTMAAALGSQDFRVAARDFVEGAAGQPRPAARAAAPTVSGVGPQGRYTPEQIAARDSVAAAMSAGRGAVETITPQQQMLQALGGILSRPHTMRDLKTVGEFLPAPTKARTARDVAAGEATAVAREVLASKIAQAQELAQTDAKGAAAVREKAMMDYMNFNAGIGGLNPSQWAQSLMLGQALEDQEN